MALLLSRVGQYVGFLNWGLVLWLFPWPGSHVFFEGEAIDAVLMLTALGYQWGLLGMIPLAAQHMEHWHRDEVFTVITMWNIWRVHCLHVLSLMQQLTHATLVMIWLDLICSLCSMYDASCWPSRIGQDRQQAFLRQ